MDLSGTYKSQPVNRIGATYQPELLRPIMTEFNRELLRRNGSGSGTATTSHHRLSDLTYFDDHPQYLYLEGRSGGQVLLSSSAASVPFTIKGATSQTSDLLRMLDASSNVLARFDPSGGLAIRNFGSTVRTVFNVTATTGSSIFAVNEGYASVAGAVQIVYPVDGVNNTALFVSMTSPASSSSPGISVDKNPANNDDARAGIRVRQVTTVAAALSWWGRFESHYTGTSTPSATAYSFAQYYSGSSLGVQFIGGVGNQQLNLSAIGAGNTVAWTLPATNGAGVLSNDGAGALWWSASAPPGAHDTLSASHGDTLADAVVLGDIIHGNGTPKWARLAGNTAAAKRFLTQTGDGAISAVPAWAAIVAGDIPDLSGTYQPLDADLTAIAALTTTAFGRSFLPLADAAAGRTLLGLGTLATQSGTFSGTSSGTNTGDQAITLTGEVTGGPGTGSFATTIANDAVTYAKIQNVSATDKLLGRSTAGAGDVEEIACTAFARTILDDADAATVRATIGAGTGGGSVTSVGLSLPADLTVSGSPVTTSGTLTAVWASQSANRVLVAPIGGAGTPTFRLLVAADLPTVPVASGGTGLTSGTSGGILGFTGSTTLASSVALTASALVLGGGAGATPTPMASLGSTTTVLHGNAAGPPTFAAISLTADVSGVLPVANGGTNAAAFTAGSVVFAGASGTYTQDNANFFWDDTNNRLGIGTASPGHALDIRATSGTSRVIIGEWAGASSYGGLSFNGSLTGGNFNFVGSPGDNSLYINRPTGGAIYFRENNAVSQMELGAGGVLDLRLINRGPNGFIEFTGVNAVFWRDSDDASGYQFTCKKARGASGNAIAGDIMGEFAFNAVTGGTEKQLVLLRTQLDDATAGAEDASYHFITASNGVQADRVQIDSNGVLTASGFRGGYVTFDGGAGGYTVTSLDWIIAQTGTMNAVRTVTLPAPATAGVGRMFIVVDESGTVTSTNVIRLTPASGTINGVASKDIATPRGWMQVYSNGSNYSVYGLG